MGEAENSGDSKGERNGLRMGPLRVVALASKGALDIDTTLLRSSLGRGKARGF